MKQINAILKYEGEGLCVEYKDTKYDVYSYELGDGIWGWTIGDDLTQTIKLFGEKAVEKVLMGEEVNVNVPFSYIDQMGYSIVTKKGKVVQMAEKDGWAIISNGVVEMPNGERLEPDAEGSPLRELGLI